MISSEHGSSRDVSERSSPCQMIRVPSNGPLEQTGMSPRADIAAASAGRSAPRR